jgi:biopolymer transport protein ExbD
MRKQEEMPGVNMTAMIDIVFQLVIFFILTAKMQEQTFDASVRMAMSPHGKAVQAKDPREITICVDMKGRITINRTVLAPDTLHKILQKAVSEYGRQTPVVIAADEKTPHAFVRRVMDICTQPDVGIWKLKFAALKERA